MFGLSHRTLNEICLAMHALEHPDENASDQACLSLEEIREIIRQVTSNPMSRGRDRSLSRRAVVHLLGCPQCVQRHRSLRALSICTHH
jgi:hypothetical protein